MKNLFTLFILAAIYFQSSASNFFWVGGTGNFSDPSHWATTSGGSTLQTLAPTTYDDVFFDVNSFSAVDDTVYFDLDYSGAHFFFVSGVLNTPTFADGPAALRIDVVGNFSIGGNINWVSTCDLAFSATADSSLSIQTNSIHLTNHVLIDGDISGSVMLMDDLSCTYLELDNGNFYSMNHAINCTTGLGCWLTTLYLGTSTVTSGGSLDFLDNAVIYSDSTTFMGPQFDVQIGITGLHFGTVHTGYISAESTNFKVAQTTNFIGLENTIDLLQSDTVGISAGVSALGPNIIHKVVAGRIATLNANAIIDTLMFTQVGIELAIPDTLTITGEIIMSNTPAAPGIIGNAFPDSCHLIVNNGIVCFDYATVMNVHASGGAQFFAGYNSTDNGGNVGLQFTGCTTPGGAWPGDANYDLTVNNLDILAIGLANGETGPGRAGASFSWVEQPVADWSNTFASGINMKHADCDGNGTVDASDTAAVSINYGLHHPAARIIDPQTTPNSNDLLTINVSPDTVGPMSPVHVDVDLGSDSIYGVAFSIFYDPALINPNSLIPNFSSSWLGTTGVNMIGFSKIDPVAGRIDFALTRTDHVDAIGGAGNLLSFDLVTADNIPVASSLSMAADNVNGVFLSQNFEVIAGSTDSTFVDSTVSVHSVKRSISNFSSYILNNELNLSFYSYEPAMLNLSVADVTGRILLHQDVNAVLGVNKRVARFDLAKGIYIVTLNGVGGSNSVKVAKE